MNSAQSPFESKAIAQWIAFAPFVHHACKSMKELGVFQSLDSDGSSLEVIRERTGLSEYALRVLLDAGVGIGAIRFEKGLYSNTLLSRLLIKDPMTIANFEFANEVCLRALEHLTDSLRSGKPEGLKELGPWKTIYEGLEHLTPIQREKWLQFDHYYSDASFNDCLKVFFKTPKRRVLDVGGNTGKWALRCVEYDRGVEVTILDLPGQLAQMHRFTENHKDRDRIKSAPMDFLDPKQLFPEGFDAIWMSQFLDCFSENEIASILERAQVSMGPSTDLYILEPFVDRQDTKTGEFCVAMTSIYFTCVANGNSRMYHYADLKRLIERAGLVIEEEWHSLGVCHSLLRCKRRGC